jgi:CubicO group peptidase (beta-lactamase class C family)
MNCAGSIPTTDILRVGLSVAAIAVFVAGCGGGSSGGSAQSAPPPKFSYTIPADNGDGWQVADLADEGFDVAGITKMMDRILNGVFPGMDSVAIVRNDRLLLYWYDGAREFDQYDAWINNQDRQRHALHSTSKSFTSALIGIAIDKAYIVSTQVPFYGLFDYPDYLNPDPRKADMTLEDALTMRLGLSWDEWSYPYTHPRNDLVALETINTDWPKALLDLPMSADPGTVFAYNTAATIAIGQALENAVDMPMADFANAYLFYPMQITNADWWRTPTGLPNGGSGLFLETRDLIKFGQLYLDGGNWQGQQLISADWVAASILTHVDVSEAVSYSEGYGYQWWVDEFTYQGQPVEAWTTSGYGGQYVFCVPSLNLVVAFTGHNYGNSIGIENLYRMMQDYILPAIG